MIGSNGGASATRFSCVKLKGIDGGFVDVVWDSINMLDFKVDCHFSITSMIQFYDIKFYSIIFFFNGGPGGATFTINGNGASGMLGAGNGLPRSSSDDCLIGFFAIPGRPFLAELAYEFVFNCVLYILYIGKPDLLEGRNTR